ncbi:MAG: Crp/Fnr family transcriptional regulator [Halioglobus sp.]|nr:Crp/Fnr family transcriptional regulator [Halioglobus sp.]
MSSIDIRQFFSAWLQARSLSFDSAFEPWLEGMREHHFEREELLVTAGQDSTRVFFLVSGLVRLYYTTPEGKERNKAFFGPDDATGAVSAAMTGQPAPFSIEALRPVQAISVDFASMLEQVQSHPSINALYIRLLSGAFIRNEQREAMLLTCNAEERYRWLAEHEPHLLEQVPQFHIASYIGVDPVSLSRIKRKLNGE